MSASSKMIVLASQKTNSRSTSWFSALGRDVDVSFMGCFIGFLTQAEVDRGVGEPPEGLEATDLDDLDEDEGPSTFRCHELPVPVEVFAGDELLDRDEDDPVVQLSYEIGNCVGGKPQWIQGEDHDGVLLFQFDEDIVEMNLGDAGLMYVFADTAFWQCS